MVMGIQYTYTLERDIIVDTRMVYAEYNLQRGSLLIHEWCRKELSTEYTLQREMIVDIWMV